MRRLRKRLRARLLPVYALVLLLILSAEPEPHMLAVGIVLVALGEGLRIWATGHLHKTEALTVTGPYAYLRHPLYLGTLLIATGLAGVAASPLAFGALGAFLVGYFAYYMPYKNRIEGARLESIYGDQFRRYAVAVPSLVPRLHAYVPLGADASGSSGWRRERFLDNNEIGTLLAVLAVVLALVARWTLT